jgi:hypothetical protein
MNRHKLKVLKVDKKNKTITVDVCYEPTFLEHVDLPIWRGELKSLDELIQMWEEIDKEELEKKYPKGSA